MIGTIMKISLINLRRDKVAFMMTFILPVIFFSIFAVIFGATDRGARDNKINVVVTDQEQTDISRQFITALGKQSALTIAMAPDDVSARKQVHDGKFPVAVVILKGFSEEFGNFQSTKESVEVVYDAANPIAQNAVGGLLQAAAMMSAPDILIERGFASMESFGGGMTPQQRQALDNVRPYMRGDAGGTGGGNSMQGMLKVRSTDVRAGEAPEESRSMIAYYAAGVGVMFLLFSMSGAGGALLDETDSGTLERLLSTNATMSQILLGKWLFLAIAGILQVTVMFLWAHFVFRLELITPAKLSGFAAMAIVTAAGAAAFGLVLAAACKTRAQLSGISTIVILIMSALGGSMVPRFVMPKFMETTALFTFNGWALDGFLKVFWYAPPHTTATESLVSLIPQLAVLSGAAVVFLAIARVLARKWETI
jgi:ABC-2 type transport system permease protein